MPPVVETDEVSDEKVVIPPTVDIKKMSSKFSEAMGKGEVPKAVVPEPKPEPPAKAPETPTAKVPEVPKEPPKVEPPKTDPKTEKPKIPAENFKILETQRDEFKAKYESAETKAKELEAKLAQAVDPAKIAELQKKLDDANAAYTENKAIVDRFYVEHSKEFKAAFVEKIKQSEAEAKESVGAEHAAKIEAILKMAPGESRNRAIEEIGDELRPFQQTNLARAYTEFRRIEKQRDEELAKASENRNHLESYKSEQERKQREQEIASLASAFQSEAPIFMKQFAEFQTVADNTEHNESVKQTFEMAKAFLDPTLAPVEKSRLALWAAKGVRSVQTDAVKDALIAKLTGQLKALQNGNPSVVGSGKAVDTNAVPKTAAQKFQEAMAHGIPKKGD